MTTQITGLVTNPNGSLLNGSITMAPLKWHANTTPDRLVSDVRATATITDGVVDLTIDADGQTPWRLWVVSTNGGTTLEATVIPPADGEVRIDQLAPATDTDVAVQPNPGPQGPPGEVTLEQLQQLVQRDSGWRCWSVADWGPVTIGTQSGIVGQYQWLWRRIGSVVFYGARMKRDTALTVTSGQAVSSYRAISPHPMWMDMSFPESNVTGFISISFRDTNDPVPLTGNTPFSIFPSVGVFNVQAASTSVGGYVPGTWCSAISAANVTDAPWPDTLPGEPYEGSVPTSFLPPPSAPLATVTGVTEAELNDKIANLRGEFNAQLSTMETQMRMNWIVDFQEGMLDALRTYDTGWVNLTAFAANAPTTVADQWQIALARRVGDVVDVILGFTLGSGRSGFIGTLPTGFHPDAENSALSPMFSPGNTARGDIEISHEGVVNVQGAGATVGNPYRAVFHFHTNDHFPMTMNRQIGGVL